MGTPTINIRATNVELTDEHKSLINQRLMPLNRYLQYDTELQIDVVLRQVRSSFRGTIYNVSVKLSTPTDAYIAVANESHLPRALTRVRETLRRSISRGASVVDYGLRKERKAIVGHSYTLAW